MNSVLATDIMDKQLGAARKARWNRAFSNDDDQEVEEHESEIINRKATIVVRFLSSFAT